MLEKSIIVLLLETPLPAPEKPASSTVKMPGLVFVNGCGLLSELPRALCE
jgi:hypothetical protein